MRRKIIRRLRTMAGTPLVVGTLAYMGGKLPGAMGTTMTSAISPAIPMVGAVVGISALGMGVDVMKDFTKIKIKKRRR